MKKLLMLLVLTGCNPPKYTKIKSPTFCHHYERLKKVDAGKFDEKMEWKLRKIYKGS